MLNKNYSRLRLDISRTFSLASSVTLLYLLISVFLAGCGQTNSDTPKVNFGKIVSFGDSLSDVGSYAPGAYALIAAGTNNAVTAAQAQAGKLGGKFTINSTSAKNWVEYMAAQLGLPDVCAATTGWDSKTTAINTATATNATCYGYAQGGARVGSSTDLTQEVGPGNKSIPTATADEGALTHSITRQISTHLAKQAKFDGTELVLITGGANDVFIQSATVTATITALVGQGQTVQAATTTAMTAAVAAMTTAANNMAAQVKLLSDAGAKYIVVVNIPDIGNTPQVQKSSTTATTIASRFSVADTLVTTFNTALAAAMPSSVLLFDAYTKTRDQVKNPAQYNLANTADPACGYSTAPSATGTTGFNTSLVCATSTTAGKDKYMFADGVHPTPYVYQLFAQAVAIDMAKKSWL